MTTEETTPLWLFNGAHINVEWHVMSTYFETIDASVMTFVKMYEGPSRSTITDGLMFLPGPFNGVIQELHVEVPIAPVGSSAIFNVRKNGSSLYSGSSRLIVTSGQRWASKTGLSLAVARGDDFHVDLEGVPSGGLQSPVTFYMVAKRTS